MVPCKKGSTSGGGGGGVGTGNLGADVAGDEGREDASDGSAVGGGALVGCEPREMPVTEGDKTQDWLAQRIFIHHIHERRRCSSDTYPEAYITKYTSIQSRKVIFEGTAPLMVLMVLFPSGALRGGKRSL